MGYNYYWVLLLFVLVFPVPTQGHEACYDDSWVYHSHTYTCFRLFLTGMLWTDARDYCRDDVQAGSDYGVTTHLAKIDDENTNNFVRNLVPNVKWSFWIGLYYNDDKNRFRWDGYPDEELKFRDPNWEEQSEPYVSLFIDGWRGRDSTRIQHYMCQQSAKRISGNVTCEHHVVANGFNITCTSKRNPIQAKCQWTYKYDVDQVPQDWTSVATPSHESVEEDGVTFYTTSCKTILSNVQPGNVAFQMKMYPAITEVDLETNQKAWTIGWVNLSVALPNQPLFKTRDKTLLTTSPVHFHENNTMDLSCEVTSGKPFVYSVNLSCEFPFKNSDVDNKDTQIETAYVIEAIASRDMNGKNCTCIGNHVSGPIESSPLTFNVTYPAEVKQFTVNGQTSLVEVDMNETLTLSCLADGNPMSSVNIRKLEPSYLDTSAWLSEARESKVEQVFEASCGHNGRYRCSAYNVYNYLEEMLHVDVRVRCPPTYCNQTSRDMELAVTPGRSQTVSLCVIAYPTFVFRLLKNSKAGWFTPDDLADQISLVTSFDSQQNVTITFPVVGPSHLGEFSLEYSTGSGAVSSVLYFRLTAPITPCKGQENVGHEVTLDQSVTLLKCVLAFPGPSILVMQKAQGSTWIDYISPNVTIVMDVDFDTLTNVRITFSEVKAVDLGEYRFYDPNEANGSARSYLRFSLSDIQSNCSACSSCLSTGIIIGLILGSNVVVIVLTIICMTAFRKFRTKGQQNASRTGGSGHTNAAFHKPGKERTDGSYVKVYEHPPMFSAVNQLQTPTTGNASEIGVYEGDESQGADETKYETIPDAGDGEEGRAKTEPYDILHADDPNYSNLNREPRRQYETVNPGAKA